MGELDISDTVKKMISHIDRQEVRSEIAGRIAGISLLTEPELLKKLLRELTKYPDGVDIINKNWRIIYNNAKDCIGLIETLASSEVVRNQMIQNVPYLINYGNYDNTADLARELAYYDGGNEAIAQNADEFVRFCIGRAEFIAMPLIETELGRQKLKEKFEVMKSYYISDKNMADFFKLIRAIKDYPEFKEEYEEYSYWADLYEEIELPKPRVLKSPEEIFRLTKQEQKRFVRDRDAPGIKDMAFSSIINSEDREEKKIILQHIANENKYQYKSIGSSSLIVQAGDQIVKLGIGRRKFDIPYHPRIMMPYFRKKYDDGSVLEIFNYGITDSAEITDEKLLEIYKELESAGIKWGDAKKENLLVLTKDNEVPDFVQSEDFNLFGFLQDERFPTTNHRALKRGDIVICDLDMLYAYDDPTYQDGDPDDIIEDYLMMKRMKDGHGWPEEH